ELADDDGRLRPDGGAAVEPQGPADGRQGVLVLVLGPQPTECGDGHRPLACGGVVAERVDPRGRLLAVVLGVGVVRPGGAGRGDEQRGTEGHDGSHGKSPNGPAGAGCMIGRSAAAGQTGNAAHLSGLPPVTLNPMNPIVF